MRPRVVRVGVLVGLPGAGLRGQPVGDVVVGVRVLGGHRRRADDHLGAVRLEDVALVLADLVGADEDAVVALGLRHHRQADTGVAGGRLDDRAAGLERARLLGGLDHPGRDPVLHRAAGVEVLHLGEHERALLRAAGRVQGPAEPEQRGVADQVEQRVHVVHRANLSGPLRKVVAWGRRGRHASWHRRRRTAAAGCRCWAARSTACSPPRHAWPGAPSGGSRATRPAPRAGTATAVRARPWTSP